MDLQTFAESKSAKISKSLFVCGGGGGGVKSTNFQPLSVLTSCESLGCTNQNDTKHLPARLSECITDSFPSETKNI